MRHPRLGLRRQGVSRDVRSGSISRSDGRYVLAASGNVLSLANAEANFICYGNDKLI